MLEVKNLKKYYAIRKSLFSKGRIVRAVDDVSFSLGEGETLGLVGESGCGKTTLGKLITRLENATSGRAYLNSNNLFSLSGKKLRESRKDYQMIFQDPFTSLNPRINILRVFDEVLALHTDLSQDGRYEKARELMLMVGLKEEHFARFPHQFSGGQRQRIGIARAIAVNPGFIVADEPVSSLDVSVQSQIINLLVRIQRETNVSLLFISHDLAVVEHISDRILVMYLGKILEHGNSDQICKNPKHPYTKLLLSAVPSVDNVKKRKLDKSAANETSLTAIPKTGCRFSPRCPHATDECKANEPALKETDDEGHFSACFLNKSF